MVSEEHRNIFKKLIFREINITELSDIISDWLFELRQSPDNTGKYGYLSDVELLICEVEDGFRTLVELEEYVKVLVIPEPQTINLNNETPQAKTVTTSSNRNAIIKIVPPTVPTALVGEYHHQVEFA